MSIKFFRYFVPFILSVFLTGAVKGQLSVTSPTVKLYEHNPVNPNAAGLAKFVETPVNMATGIPDISIPLFVIKSGRIEVPIILQYHAGGLKINETAGWVGMNWDLNVGGKAIKQTNGLDDTHSVSGNSFGNYMNRNYSYGINGYGGLAINNVTDIVDTMYVKHPPASGALYERILSFFGRIAQGHIDGEADEFYFNVPGKSGRTFYNQKENKYELANLNGWTLSDQSQGEDWGLNPLMSNNGIKYFFTQPEISKNPLLLRHNPDGTVTPEQMYITTGKYLSQISDPLSNKAVDFNYETETNKLTYAGLDMYKTYSAMNNTYYYSGEYFDIVKRLGDQIFISSISFDDGQVQFIRNTHARQDQGSRELTEIRVLNRYGKIVKRIKLNYFYNTSTITTGNYTAWPDNPTQVCDQLSKRLFLSSVQEFNLNSSNVEISQPPYTFTYNLSQSLPRVLSYAQDYWGYYNGKNNNTTQLPTLNPAVYPGVYPEADLNVDSNFTQLGTLTQIKQPTGGKTILEYENNRTDAGLKGGLRVKRVINQDSINITPVITEYEYKTANGSGSGTTIFTPKFHYDFRAGTSGESQFQFTPSVRLQNNSVYPLTAGLNSPVMYSSVLEKKISNGSLNLITRHNFLTYGSIDDPYGTLNFYNADAAGVPNNKYPVFNDLFGKEILTQTYKTTATGTELIKEDSFYYKPLIANPKYIWSVQSSWSSPYNLTPDWCTWPGNDPFIYTSPNLFPSINGYKIIKNEAILNNNYSKIITSSGTLRTDNKFSYDTANSNLKKQTFINSTGDTISILTKYVSDYNYYYNINTGYHFQFNLLRNSNCMSFPIESLKTFKRKNSSITYVTDAVYYEYDNLRLKKIYKAELGTPVTNFMQSYNDAYGFYKDASYKSENEVLEYDNNGNPLTVNNKNKLSAFVWDHLSSSVLASVVNAENTDIAYSSFENNISGNFTYSGSIVSDQNAPTGNKVYQLSGSSNITRAINSSKQYVVSLWANNSNVQVNSTAPTSVGRSANGYTLYNYYVSGSSGLSINGNANIDEVRLYPKDALMTTYTFEPIVGMTSQCDPNNKISYYEYDVLNRLILVRDQDKNILKKICYNYAGQPENCITCTNFIPNWQNTITALRCQQGSCGNTGYQEQEQRDMNPCSSTYNQTQWVVADYNPTACPVACVNLTSTNVTAFIGYTATYTNGLGDIFSFSVPAITGLQPLGNIPAGNYTLTIERTSGLPMYGTFKSGCFKQVITGSSATFYNVSVSASTCNSITVDISGM